MSSLGVSLIWSSLSKLIIYLALYLHILTQKETTHGGGGHSELFHSFNCPPSIQHTLLGHLEHIRLLILFLFFLSITMRGLVERIIYKKCQSSFQSSQHVQYIFIMSNVSVLSVKLYFTIDFYGTVGGRGSRRDGALVLARLPIHEAEYTAPCTRTIVLGQWS